MESYFKEGHHHPTARLIKVELENFKNIQHGSIVFPNYKNKDYSLENPVSDILGIYGQNGTGKTSVLQAIRILKYCLCGQSVPKAYLSCITLGCEYAKLSFTLDFQYNDENGESIDRRIIDYSFKLTAIPDESDQDDINQDPTSPLEKPKIYDEVISITVPCIPANKSSKQELINAKDSKLAPFGPIRKISNFVYDYTAQRALDLFVAKQVAQVTSRSSIFSKKTLDIFSEYSNYSFEFQILLDMRLYASNYLFIAETRLLSSTGPSTLRFHTRKGIFNLRIGASNVLSENWFIYIVEAIGGASTVLSQIVPGMELIIQESTEPYVEEGVTQHKFSLMAIRNNTTIDLNNESAGIIKIISILPILISAFNDGSCTVAIDEIDAGVFEYLLGEILSLFKERGKGQLLFTSHNLRPLEVLNKDNIYFSTANPSNRFVKFSGVAPSNNLRDMYLKEVLSGTQKEVLYDASKRYKLYEAFRKAGS